MVVWVRVGVGFLGLDFRLLGLGLVGFGSWFGLGSLGWLFAWLVWVWVAWVGK